MTRVLTIESGLYAKFATEYFEFRQVQSVVAYSCWPLIDQVEMMKMFSESNIRIVMTSKKHDRNLEKIFSAYTRRIGVIYDSCCLKLPVPLMPSYEHIANSSYVWLWFDCGGDLDAGLAHLSAAPLTVATDLTATNSTVDEPQRLDLFDVYHSGSDGRTGGIFNSIGIGSWSPSWSPPLDDEDEAPSWKRFHYVVAAMRRSDLRGLSIRTIVLTEGNTDGRDTREYLMDDSKPYVDTPSRMNYQLMRLLRSLNNFTIEFIVANEWVDKNSKGKYHSENLLGLLADKKGDIAATGLWYTDDSGEVGDAVYFTYPYRGGFIFRYLGQFGDVRMNFNSPFHREVWYCFATIILLTIAATSVIFFFEKKYVRNRIHWNVSDAVLFLVGAVCQMGSEMTPITSASRTACFIFLFASLIMYNYYTSSIVSSLLSSRNQKFTLKDLADSPLQCGTLDSGFTRRYLVSDNPLNPELKYLNAKKYNDDGAFFHAIEEGVRRVKGGDFAYQADYASVYTVIEDTFEPSEICELMEIETVSLRKGAVMMQKRSPYLKMFRIGMTKMDETGQVSRQLLKWASRKPICQASKSFVVVEHSQIESSHTILYAGIGLAFGALLAEVATTWRLGRRPFLPKIGRWKFAL